MRIYVTEELAGERLDALLAEQLEKHSRSFLQKMIREQHVTIEDRPCKVSYRPSAGEWISVDIPEPKPLHILPEPIPLSILYEDDQLLVVDKPKGMVVHPAPGHDTGTLVNALLYHCQESLSGINGTMRPGIVHRIDRDTTGALVVCKTDQAHRALSDQLKEHSINRRYVAIVHGNLPEEEGCINAPIGRHPVERKKMAINHTHGREAVTHYQVLERFGNYTYVACRLETGRTHQIRVHMSSIGHPLLGDEVYSRAKCAFRTQGQTLHAQILGFVHPTLHSYMEFKAPMPAYFTAILSAMRKQA